MAIVQVPPNEVIPGGARWPDSISDVPINVSLEENALQSVTVPLSSAQILALNGTAVTLIPAQGANVLVVVDQIIFEMTTTATAYANGGTVNFTYNTSGGASVTQAGIAAGVITAGAGVTYNTVFPPTSALVIPLNASVVVSNATAPFITGTGTARIYVKFRCINVAASAANTR
jgi:hypothetical protein